MPGPRAGDEEGRRADPFEVFAMLGAAFGDKEGERLESLAKAAMHEFSDQIERLFREGRPTRAQLRRQLGALPVLLRLLEILDVRQIINRYCPSARQVEHGAVVVVLVLVLNRLMAPRPLYKVADWLGQTVLVCMLGIPAAKFNDDRLGRTLDAITAHQRHIWLDIVSQALRRFELDRLDIDAAPAFRINRPGRAVHRQYPIFAATCGYVVRTQIAFEVFKLAIHPLPTRRQWNRRPDRSPDQDCRAEPLRLEVARGTMGDDLVLFGRHRVK